MKACYGCNVEKPLTEYYSHPSGKHGKDTYCKPCHSARSTARYHKNKEKYRIVGREYQKSIQGQYTNMRSKARKREIVFELTIQDFMKIREHPCHYCLKPLPITGYGVDRIDSNRGYTPTNVVPCCSRCNYLFNDYDKEETYAHMKRMLEVKKSLKR